MSIQDIARRIDESRERIRNLSTASMPETSSTIKRPCTGDVGSVWACSLRRNFEKKLADLGESIENEKNKFIDGIKATGQEDLESLKEAAKDPWGTLQDTASGVIAIFAEPEEALKDAWSDFSDPYVESWTNGRESEAIGRGVYEVGKTLIPGYGAIRAGGKAVDVVKGLSRRDGNSDHGSTHNNRSNDGPIDREIEPGSVDDLLNGAEIRQEAPSRMRRHNQYDLSGGFEQANHDFDQLTSKIREEDIRIHPKNPNVRTATLEDGRNVTVRPLSSEGSQDATIQIDPPKDQRNSTPKIKIRYEDDRFGNDN